MTAKNRYHFDGKRLVDNAPEKAHDLTTLEGLLIKLHKERGKTVEELFQLLIDMGFDPEVARRIVDEALKKHLPVHDPFAALKAMEPENEEETPPEPE